MKCTKVKILDAIRNWYNARARVDRIGTKIVGTKSKRELRVLQAQYALAIKEYLMPAEEALRKIAEEAWR